MDIDGANYIVIGATGEIGHSVANNLSKGAGKVILMGRNEEKLKEVQQMILNTCDVEFYKLPSLVTQKDLQKVIDLSFQANRYPQGFVYCAGRSIPRPFEGILNSEWETQIFVNLNMAFYSIQAFIKASRKVNFKNCPRVVAISSTAGIEGYPNSAAYCAAKHGIIGMVRAIASEYRQGELKICAICPGLIKSESLIQNIELQSKITGENVHEILNRLTLNQPISKWPTINELGFFISTFLTGKRDFSNGEIFVFRNSEI